MLPRKPYEGLTRKLVLAFDVGTTFSGVSYCILDPGEVPVIRRVSRSVVTHPACLAHRVAADFLRKSKLAVTPKYHQLSTMIFRETSVQWVLRLFKSGSSNKQETRDG
jgi:hypothetical protein